MRLRAPPRSKVGQRHDATQRHAHRHGAKMGQAKAVAHLRKVTWRHNGASVPVTDPCCDDARWTTGLSMQPHTTVVNSTRRQTPPGIMHSPRRRRIPHIALVRSRGQTLLPTGDDVGAARKRGGAHRLTANGRARPPDGTHPVMGLYTVGPLSHGR